MRLQVLTVKAPWAQLFQYGKDIENREWRAFEIYHGKHIIIHTAKAPDTWCVQKVGGVYRLTEDFEDWLDEQFFEDEQGLSNILDALNTKILPTLSTQLGCITGAAKLTGCVTSSASPWFVGRWGFQLEEFVPLKPVPVSGKLMFWNLSPDLDDQVRADLEQALQLQKGGAYGNEDPSVASK